MITTFKVTYALHPETGNPSKIIKKDQVAQDIEPIATFSLVEVTAKDLAKYREIGSQLFEEETAEDLAIDQKSGNPSFVLKVAGKLYYASITKDLNFVSATKLGSHKCANCHRLSAASDADGGCAKVREFSTGIERYPWITKGYETFGTGHDSFVVVCCKHYKKYPRRPEIPLEKVNNLKLGIAQYYWPDVDNLDEVKRRREKKGIRFD